MANRELFSSDPEPPVGSVVLDRDGGAWQRLSFDWHMAGLDDSRGWLGVCMVGPLALIHEAIPKEWSEGDSAPPEGTIIATPGYLPRMWVEGRWVMDGLTAPVPQNCRPLQVLRWGWGYDG